MTLEAARAVLLKSRRDGAVRRGSGFLVGENLILTADHCADGDQHVVVHDGEIHYAEVVARSGLRDVDIALLRATTLPAMPMLRCGRINTTSAAVVTDCQAMGYPEWKKYADGSRRVQVLGSVLTAEGANPAARRGSVPLLSLKLDTAQPAALPPVRAGEVEVSRSQWAGMSGAAIVARAGDDHLVVGVVCRHAPQEGSGSLTFVPISALDTLPADTARRFWTELRIDDPRGLTLLPQSIPSPPGSPAIVVGDIPSEPADFVARAIIDETQAALSNAPLVVLTGMRGTGKTHVAAAVARSRIATAGGVLGWIDARTRDTVIAGLAQIAEAMGIADTSGDTAQSARRLRSHLATWPHESLLVFDGADDVAEVDEFLQPLGLNRILVTTTNSDFGEIGAVIDVPPFTPTEAAWYLNRRSGVTGDGAARVTEALGGLPLALAAAASTIRNRSGTAERYLDRLHRYPLNTVLPALRTSGYGESTASALLMSVNEVEDADPEGLARQLLDVMAFLSPAGVRRTFLTNAFADSDGRDADAAAEYAIGMCRTRSLISWSASEDVCLLHPLLGRVIRDRADATGRRGAVVEASLTTLQAAFFDARSAWANRETGAQLVQQIEAFWATGLDGLAEPTLIRASTARRWGIAQLRAAHDLTRAIALGEVAAAETERLLGPSHLETAAILNALAVSYREAKNFARAITLFHRVLDIREGHLDDDAEDVLTTRNNLAVALRLAGRSADAVRVFTDVLARRERVLGADHNDTLSTMDGLAQTLLCDEKRIGAAVHLFAQVLDRREQAEPRDEAKILTAQNNLGAAYLTHARPGDAISILEQVVGDPTRSVDDPEILVCRSNLAVAYRNAGNFDAAIALLERTVTDTENMLGADHVRTLEVRNALAAALAHAGRYDRALDLLAPILAQSVRLFGAEHAETQYVQDMLSEVKKAARLKRKATKTKRSGR